MLVIHMNFCIMNDECLGIFRFRECLNINWTLFALVLLEAVFRWSYKVWNCFHHIWHWLKLYGNMNVIVCRKCQRYLFNDKEIIHIERTLKRLRAEAHQMNTPNLQKHNNLKLKQITSLFFRNKFYFLLIENDTIIENDREQTDWTGDKIEGWNK